MNCLEINWLKIMIQLARTTTDQDLLFSLHCKGPLTTSTRVLPISALQHWNIFIIVVCRCGILSIYTNAPVEFSEEQSN